MDDLLIKYILEEASPEESNQVQQWLAADVANQARFKKLQQVWQLASQPNGQLVIDTPSALQRLKQTLHASETGSIKRIWTRVWPAAAVVIGIAGMALGAYVVIKPKNSIKENLPVVQPDTVQQKPVRKDTMPPVTPIPALQAVPALHPDTIPVVKPHKKKRPLPVTPVQPVRPKKKSVEPVPPVTPRPVKKKRPEPAPPAHPLRKHKKATTPIMPQASTKEPPIS